MYGHTSPYIVEGQQMTAAKILGDVIDSRPSEFCVSDFSLFTTLFWHKEPGSPESQEHFFDKVHEELGEVDEELTKVPIEPPKVIEEYGDASFCVFALGNSFQIDPTIFVKDLWARQGRAGIRCRGDVAGPPYVESAIASGAVRAYEPTRYGFALLQQPYHYEFQPGETYVDHRAYQMNLIGNFVGQPLTRAAQPLIGYTLADIWLNETRRVAEAVDNDNAMLLGMADNIPKMIGRVEASQA